MISFPSSCDRCYAWRDFETVAAFLPCLTRCEVTFQLNTLLGVKVLQGNTISQCSTWKHYKHKIARIRYWTDWSKRDVIVVTGCLCPTLLSTVLMCRLGCLSATQCCNTQRSECPVMGWWPVCGVLLPFFLMECFSCSGSPDWSSPWELFPSQWLCFQIAT